MLYYAIGLDALPLEIVVAHDRFSMCQNSVVLAEECALRSPNVCQVALHLDALVLRYELAAGSHNNLVSEIADVFDGVVLLANNLSDERMRAAWEDEVMLLAEQSFQLVERL